MKTRKQEWVYRTVRGGRVRVKGVWYRPESLFMEYDGRLEGIRMVFVRYQCGRGWLPLLGMWGPRTVHLEMNDAKPDEVDGMVPWLYWYPEGA